MVFDIPTPTLPTIEFQTKEGPGAQLNVDKAARIIKDVLLIRAGEADGHGFSVETSFLQALVKYAKKEMGGRVQCNMGHRYDANFFQLGRFSGLYLTKDGTEVRAKELHVYEAADKSPAMAGMADWFFDLAQEDPEAVMCSIKFQRDGYYQYDKKGTKVYIQSNWWSGPVKQFEDQPVYIEFKRLLSCDIVDQGALTDSLFSSNGPAHAAHAFSNIVNAPGFEEWMSQNEDHFPKLQTYFQNKFKFSLGRFFSGLFTKPDTDMAHDPLPLKIKETSPAPTSQEGTTQAAPASEADATIEAAVASELTALQEQLTQLQSDIAERDSRIEALTAQVTQLSAEPAAQPTTLQSQDPAKVTGAGKSYLRNPIYLKARQNSGAGS